MLNRLPIGLGERSHNDPLHGNLLGGGHEQQPASHRGPHGGNSGERPPTHTHATLHPQNTRPTPYTVLHTPGGARGHLAHTQTGRQGSRRMAGGRARNGRRGHTEHGGEHGPFCERPNLGQSQQMPARRSTQSKEPAVPRARRAAAAARRARPSCSPHSAAPPARLCWRRRRSRRRRRRGRPVGSPQTDPCKFWQVHARFDARPCTTPKEPSRPSNRGGGVPLEPCSVTVCAMCWYGHGGPRGDSSQRLCGTGTP